MLALEPDEQQIEKWFINLGEGTEFISGSLIVTTKRVVFIGKTALSLKEFGAYSLKNEQGLSINKSEIISAEKGGNFFQKKIILSLRSGEKLVFNRGMMSVDPVIEAIGK